MHLMPEQKQAIPRTERLAVMVTPDEKRAYRFVGDAKGKTESDIAREYTTEQVMVEYERIREVLDRAA
jgi:hypothetical protein